MRRLIPLLLMFTIAALFLACSEQGEEAKPSGVDGDGFDTGPSVADRMIEMAPGIALERVGTIGDYPEADERLVVNMDAGGVLTVGGRELDLDALGKLLYERAEPRRADGPLRESLLHVVLRLDRRVPWKAAAWLMQACAHPARRIYRIHFAVRPEHGVEEGTLAVFLPTDLGLAPTPGSREKRLLRISIGAGGPEVDPVALYQRLADFPGVEALCADLDPDPLVPVGYVLRTMDVVHRLGFRGLTFRGVEFPGRGYGLPELMAEARDADVKAGIRVLSAPLRPPVRGYPRLPPVPRVRGGFAGSVEVPVAVLETIDPLEEEVKPDIVEAKPIERPIEKEEPVIEDPVVPDRPLEPPDPGPGEDRVNLALEWLERHQDPKGSWDPVGFMKLDREGPPCDGAGNATYRPGVSGLALLAFLGAGETHKRGRYRKTVLNACRYLKEIQDPEGCFGRRATDHFTYNHAVAALAMVRAYALTESPLFMQSAQSGLDFVEACRNPYLVWRYGVRPQDNDTSVSGWMFCALVAGKQAGLRVDPAGFDGMQAWLDKVTEPEFGRAGYTLRGTGPARPRDLLERYPADRSAALTAVGILSRVFLGEDPRKSEIIGKGTKICQSALPVWDEAAGSIDMYYWFYGTLAMFQVGGEPWKRWKRAVKTALESHQRMDGNFRGSWDPAGVWGREGGRVYSTALCATILEVFYANPRVFGAGSR